MRLPDDDDIYDIDQDYLGPPGKYIGRFNYRTIAVFPAVFFVELVVMNMAGVGFGIFKILWALLIASYLTGQVVDRTTYERPLKSLFVTWWHELTATRPTTRGEAAAPSPRRLRLRTQNTQKETSVEAA